MGAEGREEAGRAELLAARARLAEGEGAHRIGREPLAALAAQEADDGAALESESACP